MRKLIAVLISLLPWSWAYAQPTQEEFDALEKRVERLEQHLNPQEPWGWITATDTMLMDGDKEARFWGVSEVGYAVASSTHQQVDARLDSLVLSGVNLVRILHLDSKVGSGTPMWFADESTLKYNEKVLQALDYFIDGCRKRRIRVWLNLFHRRILTVNDGPTTQFGTIQLWDELFGNRPAGIYKGEIASLFYFDPVLREMLKQHARTLMDRTNTVSGVKYKNDPTIAILTLANEKCSARVGKGYYVGKNPRGTGSFETAWFAAWDAFNAKNGGQLKGTKSDLAKCWADLDYLVYKDMIDDLRASGVRCVVNCTATFGDGDMSTICGQLAGQILDVHVYPENDQTPDPLLLGNYRTIESVLCSARLFGRPISSSEWGSVYQQGTNARTRSKTWYTASEYVGTVGAQQRTSALVQYAADSHVLGGPTANNEVYDSYRDPDFVTTHSGGGKLFRESKPLQVSYTRHLTEGEVFGSGTGPNFSIPIIGSQPWAIKEGGTDVRVEVEVDPVKELPWLKR